MQQMAHGCGTLQCFQPLFHPQLSSLTGETALVQLLLGFFQYAKSFLLTTLQVKPLHIYSKTWAFLWLGRHQPGNSGTCVLFEGHGR